MIETILKGVVVIICIAMITIGGMYCLEKFQNWNGGRRYNVAAERARQSEAEARTEQIKANAERSRNDTRIELARLDNAADARWLKNLVSSAAVLGNQMFLYFVALIAGILCFAALIMHHSRRQQAIDIQISEMAKNNKRRLSWDERSRIGAIEGA